MPDTESPLKRAVRRLSEALQVPDHGAGPDTYRVRGYDVGLLFETLKRYGGRRDWTPNEANLERLPGPVLRYIMTLRSRIFVLQSELIRSEGERRRLEAAVAELRHPPR